jgi:hypothetical protein
MASILRLLKDRIDLMLTNRKLTELMRDRIIEWKIEIKNVIDASRPIPKIIRNSFERAMHRKRSKELHKVGMITVVLNLAQDQINRSTEPVNAPFYSAERKLHSCATMHCIGAATKSGMSLLRNSADYETSSGRLQSVKLIGWNGKKYKVNFLYNPKRRNIPKEGNYVCIWGQWTRRHQLRKKEMLDDRRKIPPAPNLGQSPKFVKYLTHPLYKSPLELYEYHT